MLIHKLISVTKGYNARIEDDMDISMVGIDYNKASIEHREKFAFTQLKAAAMAKQIIEKYKIKGCIILSTCNRTELWFSGLSSSPFQVFLKEKEIEPDPYKEYFVERYGDEAVSYLFQLACGMHSQIFGEDQILSQVKDALTSARENHHIDTALETLFRLAITASKKVKTEVTLTTKDNSVPGRIISLLKNQFGSLADKRCLVIGNGEIGRLMVQLLLANECQVTMTLRQYKSKEVKCKEVRSKEAKCKEVRSKEVKSIEVKSKEVIIPQGCNGISYDSRYDVLNDMDFIFSATLSPHYTIQFDEFINNITDRIYYFYDLAIPRDIDPKLKELRQVRVYDMDSLGIETSCNKEELVKAKIILDKYKKEFTDWYYERDYIPMIQKIGTATGEIADAKLTKEYKKIDIPKDEKEQLRNSIQSATQKSVEKLIFAAKEHMDIFQWTSFIQACNQAIEELE